MLFAFLSTLLLGATSVAANKSRQAVGPMRANLGRLLMAFVVLAILSYSLGRGVSGAGLWFFVLSGGCGIGIGDTAFFAALPFLGSRLSAMLMQCLAVPTAIIVEWLWLDTRLHGAQFACIGVVLGGIMIALMPTRQDPPKVRVRPIGILFGIIAALGQGLGAVLSRRGFAAADDVSQQMDGFSAALQRNLGGSGLIAAWFVALHLLKRGEAAPARPRLWSDYRWTATNALLGPILAMTSMQFALATTPSGIVLPIMATTPLWVIPFAYWIEGERPSKRSLGGGALAVAGAVGLTLV